MKKHPKLYEINTAVWLYELSLKYGRRLTLGNVPFEEWDRFKDLGFDCLWLMGIWKRSLAGFGIFQKEPQYIAFKAYMDAILKCTDEDIIGSPYSISSYDPDPSIGGWEDVKMVKDELHKRGMKLILDFVPNHTAPDHPWVYEHPEYYIQGTISDFEKNPLAFTAIQIADKMIYVARGKDPNFPPWTDTVQLNYFNPQMRSALLEELKKIACCCDGVRCDMAMLVLNQIFKSNWQWAGERGVQEMPAEEFWQDVRGSVPELILIAEAYWNLEWELQRLGFDYVYDKRLYDRLQGESPDDVFLHLRAEISYQNRLVRFIENHDEPRSAVVFEGDKLFAAAVLYSTLPGMKLYHNGQIEGRKIKIPVQLRRIKEETPDERIGIFYSRLLSIISHDVFSDGEWELKEVISGGDASFRNLIAYVWRLNNHLRLIAVNLAPHISRGRIRLQKETAADSVYILHDELNVHGYERNGHEMSDPGLYIILEGYRAHIFDIAPA